VVAGVVAAYLLFATSLVGARRPALRRYATALGVLVAMQIGAGLVNLGLLAPVWMQIVHLLLADLVWMALVVLAASSLADPASQTADAQATDARVAQGA
jgi:heme A synthase